MIRTTRLRRMILQLRHTFFTEVRTFMFCSLLIRQYHFARKVIRQRVKS
jgi:hypothetical protein